MLSEAYKLSEVACAINLTFPPASPLLLMRLLMSKLLSSCD